jgi:hypothetical protein
MWEKAFIGGVSATSRYVSASICRTSARCGKSVMARVIFAAFFGRLRVIREIWLILRAEALRLGKKENGTRALEVFAHVTDRPCGR